jgi:hypothetical protein
MLEIFMEKLACKYQISWKWVCERDFFFPFAKNFMLFGGLELHSELLKDANPIIQNCHGRR